MKRDNLRQYLLYASQVFLVFIVLVLFDLFYRWDSLLRQLNIWEIINTFFLFCVLFFVFSLVVSLPYLGVFALFQRLKVSWLNKVNAVFYFILFLVFVRINFSFLNLWIINFLKAQKFDKWDRIASLVSLFILLAIFFVLHYFVFRKRIDPSDAPRLIAALLIPFVLVIFGIVLVSVAIEHHPTKTAFLQQYGWTIFFIYYFFYFRNFHQLMQKGRLFTILAITIFVISLIGVGYASAVHRTIPEIPIDISERKGVDRDVKNIIMITFDGLSANRMSLYGNERPTTSVMDELGKMSYVFENMHAEADETIQSISAIHTGRHYYGNKIPEYGMKVAQGNTVGYMPRFFDALGWESAYLFYGPNLHSGREDIFTYIAPYNDAHSRFIRNIYGTRFQKYFYTMAGQGSAFSPAWLLAFYNDRLSQYVSWIEQYFGKAEDFILPTENTCFDGYRALEKSVSPIFYSPLRVCGPGDDRYNPALDYLEIKRPQNTFLWLHIWAPHQPYIRSGGPFLDDPSITYEKILADGSFVWNSPPLDPQYEEGAKKLRLLSEEYIAGVDQALGRFLKILKDSGLFDNSMLIISADHGQAFEKGDMFHLTRVMYEQTMRVPLIIHMPGQTKGKRIKTLAQHADIMPTILDTLGMPAPQWMEGETLWKYIEREKNLPIERTTFSQAVSQGLSFTQDDSMSELNTFIVYKGDYKLIYRFFANRRFEEIDPPDSAKRFLEHYPQVELFNLASDPNEDSNLADRETGTRDELLRLVKQQINNAKRLNSNIRI